MAPTPQHQGLPGLHVDYLEWKAEMLPGVGVELIELVDGAVNLSELYIKPGTVLDLDEIEFLESKIAL
ncbi:MAG TPA: hypothetical protein VH165_10470 [Kofleriaceae bacterium]|jgi:hypothetical protein|nr:hypothetical protein [Kofleriaceae bacterium]